MTNNEEFVDVMVDIETLGTSPNAAIVQIAAVRFDPWARLEGAEKPGLISSPEGSFYFTAKLTGDPTIDGDMDWSTVHWWLKQSKGAQQRVFEPAEEPKNHIGTGVLCFVKWLTEMPFKRVWAAGPQFDLVLLKRTFERTVNTMPIAHAFGDPRPTYLWPIRYTMERDFRTLREVGKLLGVPEPIRVGVAHDALDDAHHQAAWAIEILRAANVSALNAKAVR